MPSVKIPPAAKKAIPANRETTGAGAKKPTKPATTAPAANAARSRDPAAKPQVAAVALPAGASRPAKPAKPVKPKKPKLVRDSFTIPKAEYVVLDELKLRSVKLARPVKKSELLRAGIKALAGMTDAGLLAALQAVPAIKTGRPANS